MSIIKKIYILLAVVLLASCSSNDECREKTEVLMQMGFYTKTFSNKTENYISKKISITNLSVNGLGVDSFLYQNATVSGAKLPLKILEEQTDFVMRFDSIQDTVSVFYKNNDQFYLSLECGCVTAHTIHLVTSTKNYIDSISIINSNVNTASEEHIQIYHF